MTDDTTLDTTIHEPAWASDEAATLLFALERTRAQFAWKVGGLDSAALHAPHPPSTMTLAGLVKHLALVEDMYTARDFGGPDYGRQWAGWDGPEWEWRSAADDSAEELYALWRDAVARSQAAIAHLLAAGGPDQLTSRVLDDGQSPNLRRALTDLHDEYARHVGHADLFREATDGLVGEDPPQP
ncbi:mycothiol transferase [Cellulomonas hominis]